MTPPNEVPPRNAENLTDSSPENVLKIFKEGFEKAKKRTEFLGNVLREISYLAMQEKCFILSQPCKYFINIFLTFKLGDRRENIGNIVSQKEGSNILKSSDEIANDIVKMVYQFEEGERARVCKLHNPEEVPCEKFTLVDKTNGRVLVRRESGHFIVDGKDVIDPKDTSGPQAITPERTDKVIFGEQGKYIVIEMYDKGNLVPDWYHIDTSIVKNNTYSFSKGKP